MHVITKLVANKRVVLESFRSLEDKEALLDEAILSGNGDAILAVFIILFLDIKRLNSWFLFTDCYIFVANA